MSKNKKSGKQNDPDVLEKQIAEQKKMKNALRMRNEAAREEIMRANFMKYNRPDAHLLRDEKKVASKRRDSGSSDGDSSEVNVTTFSDEREQLS